MRRIEYGYLPGYTLALWDAQQIVGPGWAGLITELFLLSEENGLHVGQIKEKYGGLCWYFDGGDSETFDAVEAICERAYHICEMCGAPGMPREGGWIKTLCDECVSAR